MCVRSCAALESSLVLTETATPNRTEPKMCYRSLPRSNAHIRTIHVIECIEYSVHRLYRAESVTRRQEKRCEHSRSQMD